MTRRSTCSATAYVLVSAPAEGWEDDRSPRAAAAVFLKEETALSPILYAWLIIAVVGYRCASVVAGLVVGCGRGCGGLRLV